jgi:hypothetical protein
VTKAEYDVCELISGYTVNIRCFAEEVSGNSDSAAGCLSAGAEW